MDNCPEELRGNYCMYDNGNQQGNQGENSTDLDDELETVPVTAQLRQTVKKDQIQFQAVAVAVVHVCVK